MVIPGAVHGVERPTGVGIAPSVGNDGNGRDNKEAARNCMQQTAISAGTSPMNLAKSRPSIVGVVEYGYSQVTSR